VSFPGKLPVPVVGIAAGRLLFELRAGTHGEVGEPSDPERRTHSTVGMRRGFQSFEIAVERETGNLVKVELHFHQVGNTKTAFPDPVRMVIVRRMLREFPEMSA